MPDAVLPICSHHVIALVNAEISTGTWRTVFELLSTAALADLAAKGPVVAGYLVSSSAIEVRSTGVTGDTGETPDIGVKVECPFSDWHKKTWVRSATAATAPITVRLLTNVRAPN